MVGMRDVANKAGVSLSTVSLVVNGTGYVSAAMRERVETAMQALDYIPNELARNLYHDRTNMVGVIVPTIRHPFFATLTAALQRVLAREGLNTLLCSTADAREGESQYVDMLRRHMMDGVVMAAHSEHPSEYWTSIGRPVVAFDRYLGKGIASVGSDHHQGGVLIAEHLLGVDANHVVMVGGPRAQFHDRAIAGAGEDDTTFPTVRYYLALEHALGARGVVCDYVEAGEVGDFQGYARAVHEVFERFVDVDVVVSSDVGAAYALQEAANRGIDVPGDLQVVAYDGTLLADAAGMRLTAIQQDCDAIAAAIGARMVAAIAGEDERDSAGTPDDAGVPRRAGAARADVRGAKEKPQAHEAVDDLIPVVLRVGATTRH